MKFIFDVLSSIRFYCGVLTILVVVYFFPGLQIFSGIRLPSLPTIVWAANNQDTSSRYFPQRVVENVVVGVTYASMHIAQDTPFYSVSSRAYDNEYQALLGLEQEIRGQASLPLDDLLQNSSDRDTVLNAYIQELEGLIFRANDVIASTRSQIDQLERENTACTSNKEQADRAYNQAISQGNTSDIDAILEQAQEYAACQSRTRILINSYLPPLQALSNTVNTVQQYIQVLEEHTQVLSEYYELFDSEVLDDIIRAKQALGL